MYLCCLSLLRGWEQVEGRILECGILLQTCRRSFVPSLEPLQQGLFHTSNSADHWNKLPAQELRMRMKSALNLLSLVCLCAAQKKWTQDTSEWDGRDKPNGKSCSNLTQVLDNWKYAIMYQVKDMLVNDHASILPEYVRIQPLSDAVGDLYKQFDTLKENLAKLTNKFDKVESFVDEIQAGKFPKPKLWTPQRVPVRRIPVKSPVRIPGKAMWAQRRARRGPGT